MNFNQTIIKLMRMATMWLLNWGIRRVNAPKPGQRRTAQQRSQEKTARDTVKRARQAARLTRRM